MAFPRGSVLDAISLVIEMFALIACLRAAEAPARMVKVVTVLAVLSVLIGISPWYSGLDLDKDLVRGVTLLLVLTALPSITFGLVRQLKRDQTVNIRTILGALCTYVLLIIAFASAFGVSAAIEAGPFFEQGAGDNQYGDYVYFAVTTVTTLGIGDLTPATAFGRSLTGMLALVGQIYVVTVVALIVGNLGRGVLGKARNEGEED
jgi:Ca2+/Na+ antiporter